MPGPAWGQNCQHPGAGLSLICAGWRLTQLLWPPELEPVQAAQNKTGKYVPPSLRDGASRRGESMQPNRRGEPAGGRLPFPP